MIVVFDKAHPEIGNIIFLSRTLRKCNYYKNDYKNVTMGTVNNPQTKGQDNE